MVDYVIKMTGGREARFEFAACFGRMRGFGEYINWNWGRDKHVGLPERVLYWPEVHCGREAATAWFAHLLSHPLWSACVVEGTAPADLIGSKSMGNDDTDAPAAAVVLSTDVNPHQLLNTLSMFRHVHKFPAQVDLWYKLVRAGADQDAAAITCTLLTVDGGNVIVWGSEDGEHAVFSRRYINAARFKKYVSLRKKGVCSLDYYDKEVTSYREYKSYERNGDNPVTAWIVDYKGVVKSDDMVERKLLPSTLRIIYDKEAKRVISSTPEFKTVSTSDLSELVATINQLGGVS